MGLGTSIGGKKIIKSVGMDMVKLEKYQGFSADIAASACLLLSSLFGIPVSTTHVKTTAIMGVGAVKTPVRSQSFRRKGDGAYVDTYLPRLRIDRVHNGKGIYSRFQIKCRTPVI